MNTFAFGEPGYCGLYDQHTVTNQIFERCESCAGIDLEDQQEYEWMLRSLSTAATT